MAVVLSPQKAGALSIFSPFGGRVTVWLPEAPGCLPITAAVGVATAGTVTITIEQLKVGAPKGGTFGILRINGMLVPGLTKIYSHKMYQIPGNWVLGNSFDLCKSDFAGKLGSKVVDAICGVAAGTCPINNLVHKMGTSLIP